MKKLLIIFLILISPAFSGDLTEIGGGGSKPGPRITDKMVVEKPVAEIKGTEISIKLPVSL